MKIILATAILTGLALYFGYTHAAVAIVAVFVGYALGTLEGALEADRDARDREQAQAEKAERDAFWATRKMLNG